MGFDSFEYDLRELTRQPRRRFVASLLGEVRVAADVSDQEREYPGRGASRAAWACGP